MKNKFLGIITLIIAGIAIIASWIVLIIEILPIGIFYGVCMAGGGLLILYSYCSKCPAARNGCAHYFPGKIIRYLPQRKAGSYTKTDLAGIFFGIFILIGIPQPWIFEHTFLFLVYWMSLAVSLILIRWKLCLVCTNAYCALCKNHKLIESIQNPENRYGIN
jgi:hypothetical protein